MKDLTFIDLFAGIGGFRLGMEKAGFKCIFSSEINKHACDMYEENFNDNPYNDITKLDPSILPDFDILCAGFPCQSFSISGKQKGFYDATRGTLFFDICRILDFKKPPVFILENVKNLDKHDKGRTLSVMLDSLHDLGYTVTYKVLNAKDFGVPQNRERVVIVGNRFQKGFSFESIHKKPVHEMKSFLDIVGNFETLSPEEYTLIENYKKQEKSDLVFIGYRNKKIRTVGVRPGTEHLSRVHKQPNRIYDVSGVHPTLSSQEPTGRYYINDYGLVRKLTIDECYRFMGFPSDFKKIGKTSQLYERIGNSICVNMVEAVASEVINQFFNTENEGEIMQKPFDLLEGIYRKASENPDSLGLNLPEEKLKWCKDIVSKEETHKGVYTVLITSLTYKALNPNQDVRLHQANMAGGYSGRSFDTKFVTPFLKSKRFAAAMKESGWLTRSLEQNMPYDYNFPGKISDKNVKSGFLNILDDIETYEADPLVYIEAIFTLSIINKRNRAVILINPIVKESSISINEIIRLLELHFYYKYSSRGASILPVIAMYSIYQCIVQELKRFDGKYLDELGSHNSPDNHSGATGDIVVRDSTTNEVYEAVEVKFEIAPNEIMIDDAYNKFSEKVVQRYYVLSTKHVESELEMVKINELIAKIQEEHGCQIIINGIFPTLRYYLRLISNTDSFIDYYVENLTNSSEINFEHKIAWNKIQEQ